MELIDREKVMSTIRNMVELPNEVRAQVLGAISRAKAVDAKPVVHGKWIEYGASDHFVVGIPGKCSVCGMNNFKYRCCPNCGAKMDGGTEDGNEKKAD